MKYKIPTKDNLYTIFEASKIINVPPSTIRAWRKRDL
jgi:hypothetical protein